MSSPWRGRTWSTEHKQTNKVILVKRKGTVLLFYMIYLLETQ